MATTIKLIKNTHNKNQWAKYELLEQFVVSLPRESYPNGNMGFCQKACRDLFQNESCPYQGLLVEYKHGDPRTMHHMVLDPSRLTKEQMEMMRNTFA